MQVLLIRSFRRSDIDLQRLSLPEELPADPVPGAIVLAPGAGPMVVESVTDLALLHPLTNKDWVARAAATGAAAAVVLETESMDRMQAAVDFGWAPAPCDCRAWVF